jgi:hypothetical protein
LAEANFDPEFFERHEKEIVTEYRKVGSKQLAEGS